MLSKLMDYLINKNIDKNKLSDIHFILGEIILDLEIIIRIQNNYVKRHLSEIEEDEKYISPSNYNRVIHSFLFLSLFKYIELYEMHKDVLCSTIKDESPKKIYKELMKLDIRNFRNKYIGHIVDGKTNRPISDENYNSFFNKIDEHHKSLYALYLKLDTYDFLKYPLLVHLKSMKKVIGDQLELGN